MSTNLALHNAQSANGGSKLFVKISELFEKKQKQPGTYAAAALSDKTKHNISQYFKDNDVKNPCDVDKMHCTILYSSKHLPDYKAKGKYDKPLIGKNCRFEIWPNREKTENVLVLRINCPEMTKRHKHLMKEHDAQYDFPDYKPHVSFSYDVGDVKVSDFKPIDFDIEFTTEYQEDLD